MGQVTGWALGPIISLQNPKTWEIRKTCLAHSHLLYELATLSVNMSMCAHILIFYFFRDDNIV